MFSSTGAAGCSAGPSGPRWPDDEHILVRDTEAQTEVAEALVQVIFDERGGETEWVLHIDHSGAESESPFAKLKLVQYNNYENTYPTPVQYTSTKYKSGPST